MVLDTLLVSATAPGQTGAAGTVAPPGSLTLQPDANPRLAMITTLGRETASRVRVITPSGHDTTFGFELGGGYSVLESRTWTRFMPQVSRGETLGLTFIGTSTASQVELAALSIAYDAEGGAEWVDPDSLGSRLENVTSASLTLTPSTNGLWPTGTALSDFHSQLRPQRRYAVLGFDGGGSANILGVMLTGPDTGWLRQLWPLSSQGRGTIIGGEAIARIASEARIGVPVITGGNASQTRIGLVGNDIAPARMVTVYLGLLK